MEIEAVKKTYGSASGFSNGAASSGTDGKILYSFTPIGVKINVYDSNNI